MHQKAYAFLTDKIARRLQHITGGRFLCSVLRSGEQEHCSKREVEQQQRGKKRQKKLFHSAGLSVADPKFRVYSISCGVLMAVVSPMTVRSVSKAATGISNVEPGSVVRTS